jgi:hypothetical protein
MNRRFVKTFYNTVVLGGDRRHRQTAKHRARTGEPSLHRPAGVIQCGVRIWVMAREEGTSAARAAWRPRRYRCDVDLCRLEFWPAGMHSLHCGTRTESAWRRAGRIRRVEPRDREELFRCKVDLICAENAPGV